MLSSRRASRWSVHNGTLLVHQTNNGRDVHVHIPSNVWEQSSILVDLIESLGDESVSQSFTLALPTEWVRAWMTFYSKKEEAFASGSIPDLVHSLLVRLYSVHEAPIVLSRRTLCPHIYPQILERLQVADFLAIESQVQDVISAIAARLCTAEQGYDSCSGSRPGEVLFSFLSPQTSIATWVVDGSL
jgi:hypothetical protein